MYLLKYLPPFLYKSENVEDGVLRGLKCVGNFIYDCKSDLNLRCDSRFQPAFTACNCVFKVITLIWVNAPWKRLSQRSLNFVFIFNSNLPVDGLRVRGGEWDTQNTIEPLKHQDRSAKHVSIHPLFNPINLVSILRQKLIQKAILLKHRKGDG